MLCVDNPALKQQVIEHSIATTGRGCRHAVGSAEIRGIPCQIRSCGVAPTLPSRSWQVEADGPSAGNDSTAGQRWTTAQELRNEHGKMHFREECARLSMPEIKRLPSAAITAQRLLDLAERPAVGAVDLMQVVQGDPGSVLGLLQGAGRDRPALARCTSVQAAIERLGIAKAMYICLGFRLLDRRAAGGVDYIRFWRHALLRSAYAGAIAYRLRRADCSEIKTAATLCNLGDLRMHKNMNGMCGADISFDAYAVSSVIIELVNASCNRGGILTDIDAAVGCVVLAESMANVWLCADWKVARAHTQQLAQRLFGEIPNLCAWVFGVLGPQAIELESLLHIQYPRRRKIIELYELAKNLRAICITVPHATGVAGDIHCRRQKPT